MGGVMQVRQRESRCRITCGVSREAQISEEKRGRARPADFLKKEMFAMKKTFCALAAVAALMAGGHAPRASAGEDVWRRGNGRGVVRVISPDTAETWAVNGVTTHYKLFWDGRRHELLALLTFANSPRVTRWEQRQEEQRTFRLPGVELEPDGRTLSIRDSGGRIAVGALTHGFFGEAVRPAAGTLVRVAIDRRGTVRVSLHASDRPVPRPPDEPDSDDLHWHIDGLAQPI